MGERREQIEQKVRPSKTAKQRALTGVERKRKPLAIWSRRGLFVVAAAVLAWNLRLMAFEFALQHGNLLWTESGKFPEARYKVVDEIRYKYEKAILLNPYSPEAHYNLAYVYMFVGERQKALESFLTVRRLARHFSRLDYSLTGVYLELNDLEKAREEAQLAIRLDGLPSSWLRAGVVEARLGNLSDAKTYIYRALKEDERLDGADPRVELGRAYQKAGDLSQAEEEYKKALRFSPDDHMIHNNLGTVYFGLGKYNDAKAEYDEALRLNPRDDYAYANLASLYAKQGKANTAREVWNKARSLHPGLDESGGGPWLY